MSGKYPIKRKGNNYKTFKYYWKNGNQVKDKDELKRIKSLGIPPAYCKVKIYKPNSKVQATGTDDRGRIQYKYHPRWVEERNRKKFRGLIEFAIAYPKIRRAINRDLPKTGPPTSKIQLTALTTGILNTCRLRPGHDRHLRETGSYGTTTLCKKHFRITTHKGKRIIAIKFVGKSAVVNECSIPASGSLGKTLIAQLKTIKQKGNSVFELKDGTRVTPADMNEYLRKVGGKDVTAKGFRTYHANVRFIQTLLPSLQGKAIDDTTYRKKHLKKSIIALAEELHHTPSTFKKSYLFPDLLDLYTNDPKSFKRAFYKKNTEKALSTFLRKHTDKNRKVPKNWKDDRNTKKLKR